MSIPGQSPLQSSRMPHSRRGRSGTAAIAGTAVIAILAVMVVVLSYRSGHRQENSVSLGDFSAVEARVDALAGQMAVLRENMQSIAKQRKPYGLSPTAIKANHKLATCMSQVQHEVDDLIAYLQFRTTPRRRVSPT